ncbi:MAG: GNA1162 family protein [Verrucomicrobiia bacterium]
MKTRLLIPSLLAMALTFTGCATKPYDYTNFRTHPPRSILVLPPINESTDTRGTYVYLSTVTRPLAEMGYYVYPVAVVDQFMKENGLPTAGEMHQVPLDKITDVFGADAVLYVTVKQYGSKYQIITSTTIVTVEGKLVDVKTGLTLWEGTANVQQSSSSGNPVADLIAAAVDQVINSSTDQAHEMSHQVNVQLFMTKNHGLLYGPHFPEDRKQ